MPRVIRWPVSYAYVVKKSDVDWGVAADAANPLTFVPPLEPMAGTIFLR